MKHKNWLMLQVAIFILVSIGVVKLNIFYKEYQHTIQTQKIYSKLASKIIHKLQVLIEEKTNATLTIALALSENSHLQQALIEKQDIGEYLKGFSLRLRQETEFKNVWFELVEKNGEVVSRSWSSLRGDNLFAMRELNDITKVHTLIDVDRFNLSFRAFVPFYDESRQFIGFLETITHFNSIAKKIAQEGFEPVIVVDKHYAKRLKLPFEKYFIDGYYIANSNIEPKILQYIKTQGIESMLEYQTHYAIGQDYTVVHHTLLDAHDKAMAYILMFKPHEKIDRSSLDNIHLSINIVTLLVIVALILILIGFHNRYEKHSEKLEKDAKTQKYFVPFFIFFAVTTTLFGIALQISYNQKRERFIQSHDNAIEKDFDTIQNKYKTVAHTMYETVINHQSIKQIVHKAYESQSAKDLAKEELYKALIGQYKFFQTYDVRQLHFHLRNNESFLRFHRPKKYGDNLSGIRSTVEWVNRYYMPISGFEEGRIYNGFRYLFALSDTLSKEHLGSVEVSFSVHAIAKEFAYLRSAKTGFFIDKKVVNKKVFTEEKGNYADSPLEDFYYETSIKKQLEREFEHAQMEQLDPFGVQNANKKIFDNKIFTLISDDQKHLFTFVPLQNPVTKEVVGAIVLQFDNATLMAFRYNYLVIFGIGLVTIALTTIFLYREYLSKNLFRNLSLRTKSILDTQKSLIVITTGKEILETNQTFLDFFGYDSLENFKSKYRCVSECFILHEGYFHLGKTASQTLWIEHIEKLHPKDQVVLMRDKNATQYSFAVALNYYQDNSYVVSFNDISQTFQEQIILQHKIIMDSLTGAYNREFYKTNINKIIQKREYNHQQLGVIFFDIDHFKTINDTYGHAIGDEVLKELVERVSVSIRNDDYLLRWGGEEFVVFIATHSLKQAKRASEHLRSMIEHHPFKEVGKLTCSFGVTLHQYDEAIEKTIQRADEALYISKESGRNRVTTL